MEENPFIVSGYSKPELFCDREMETGRLLSAIRNKRHLTLFSLRRMGKTGLIKHAFYQLKGNERIVPVYLDLMPTVSLADFTNVFAKAVFSKMAQKEGMIKKILSSLASLRPTLALDPVSGSPEISIKVEDITAAEYSLAGIFQYLSQQDQHFVCAVDEFQQIALYPEKNTEALLRSHIQQLQNLTFLFSGSRKHTLTAIFSTPNRPFFNSTEIMELASIESGIYKGFINSKFTQAGKTISGNALDRIEQLTQMHTFYVQYLCNRLFGRGLDFIDEDDVNRIYYEILMENEPVYANLLALLTPLQFKLLKAIARNRGGRGLLSKEFLQENSLGAASSVSTAIKSLIDKEFIYSLNGSYMLTDRFFSGWLQLI